MRYITVCSGIEALGNSMAVPVVRWIGEQITLYNALARAQFTQEVIEVAA